MTCSNNQQKIETKCGYFISLTHDYKKAFVYPLRYQEDKLNSISTWFPPFFEIGDDTVTLKCGDANIYIEKLKNPYFETFCRSKTPLRSGWMSNDIRSPTLITRHENDRMSILTVIQFDSDSRSWLADNINKPELSRALSRMGFQSSIGQIIHM